MAKAKASLEEGLNNSADKRGLHGRERHTYIGGALHNMGKAKTRSGKHEPVARTHTAPAPAPAKKAAVPAPARKEYAPAVKRGTAPAPGRTAIPRTPGKTGYRPKPKPRERLELTVKINKEASEKVPNKAYTLYSIYRGKELYGNRTFRKRAQADAEKKIEMDRHNHPRGVHARPGIF